MSGWRHPLCGRPMTLGPDSPHSVTCPVRCVRYQGHSGPHECVCQWGGVTNALEDAFEDLADRARATLKAAISIAKNSYCDCPLDPHHRWNCALTPVWAQTMRDLNVNPWTVIKPYEMQLPKENQ